VFTEGIGWYFGN